MIKSERQYNATKNQLQLLIQSIEHGHVNLNAPTALIQGAKNGVTSLIEDLKKELKEYEDLKTQSMISFEVKDWNDFLRLPIKFRIANGLTIEQFAKKVNVHSRQIAGYEKEEYRNVTMATFTKILENIDINPINLMNKVA